MRVPRPTLILLIAAVGYAHAQTNTLKVELTTSRSINDPVPIAVKKVARSIALLTDGAKRRVLAKRPSLQISFPVRVVLTRNGLPLGTRGTRSAGPITLQFDTTAGHTFSASYQTLLQTVFNDTESELTAKFGHPLSAGTILVSNYDSTIDDRDAVAGGIYLPDNGSGQQQIEFPVYNANETAAVNFVHTLLLAYQGTSPYAYDAFEEGLARAVTAAVMRENLVPGLDMGTVESVLSSTYDVQGYYDWYNQRGLTAPQFIAPNLISQPLATGTNGGLYLLRYRMSSSAWSKVLTEYPTFASQLNALVEATPSLVSNVPDLVAAGQTVLNASRPGNPTIEGLSFAEWYQRQFILQTTLVPGSKVVVEAVPEDPDPTAVAVPDFGLFDFGTTYFSTDSSGNESLLANTAYPIYLDNSYNRFSPAAQDDSMAIAVGYGSVTPNFLSSYTGGQIYRVAVDIPVNDQVTRVFVPAGGVSTSLNTTNNEVFGTVSGSDPASGSSLDVKIYVGSDLVTDAPVVNGAFGVNVLSQFESEYAIARTVEAQVWQTTGSASSMIYDRFVDKPATGLLADGSQVGLALDLRVGGDSTYSISLAAGLNAIGFPIDPYLSDPGAVLGISDSQMLVGRYDGITGKYILNPSVEPFKIGHGFFVEVPSNSTPSIAGRTSLTTPVSVALEPGWNLISNPLPSTVSGSQILVYHADDLSTPSDFTTTAAAGVLLGNTFFAFVPGADDPIAGYPTTGSFTAATQFAPGAAFFVQCLAPEGVVLEFIPGSTAGVKKRSIPPPTLEPRYQLHVGISNGTGDEADCVLGLMAGATDGFDRTLDSAIPPSMGGLQIASKTTQSLYRDFRAPASPVTYTLTVNNLRIGRPYTMNFMNEVGAAPRITLRDQASGVSVPIRSNGRYFFVPNTTSKTFTLSVMGITK